MFIPLLDLFGTYCEFGFLMSMLEPFIKKFAGANQSQAAIAFSLMSANYMVFSLLAGWVSQSLFVGVVLIF